jgi:hypothetical protein
MAFHSVLVASLVWPYTLYLYTILDYILDYLLDYVGKSIAELFLLKISVLGLIITSTNCKLTVPSSPGFAKLTIV